MRPAGATDSSSVARRRSPSQAATERYRRSRPSEAYGFVGSIAAVAAALAYLAWAYAPEPWLHYIGATYYPNKYAPPPPPRTAVASSFVRFVSPTGNLCCC
jgi:phosphatidylinositol glycan class P protein